MGQHANVLQDAHEERILSAHGVLQRLEILEPGHLGQSVDDPFDVLQLEFWNRTLRRIWSPDGTTLGPGSESAPSLTSTNGALTPSDVEYMVAESGIVPVGRVLQQKFHYGGRGVRTWTLYRITPPLRLRRTIEGVYADGWGKPVTALNQFSFGDSRPRLVKVHVFRTGAARLYPATVEVRIGTIGIVANPNSLGVPALAAVRSTKSIRVPNHLNHTFTFRAPPTPFRVETSVTPFPHSRDPAIGDPRDLGANVQYSVVPGS